MSTVKFVDPTVIDQATTLIKSGELVAFPTETVYGLGADATQPKAVAKIFDAKGRPRFDPLIVHVASPDEAQSLWTECPPIALKLMKAFWPGPLTLVLPKIDRIPDIVTAGLPTVAVRMPDHPMALDLIRRAGCPIAAPSANRFNRPSPTTAQAVREELGSIVKLILDGGPTRVGVESTVLSFINDKPILLRPGGVTLEALQKIVGPIQKAQPQHVLESPGMLERHYSPQTPLYILELGNEIALLPLVARNVNQGKVGLLTLKPETLPFPFNVIEVLSPSEDLVEGASKFFQAIRRLDHAGLDIILALPIPEHGLGLALMDRLRRAAIGKAFFKEGKLFLVLE